MSTLLQIFVIALLIIVLVLSAILIAISSKNLSYIIDNKKSIKKGGMLSKANSDIIYDANNIEQQLGINEDEFNKILNNFMDDLDIEYTINGDIITNLEIYGISKEIIKDIADSSGSGSGSGSSGRSGSGSSSSSSSGSSSSSSSSGSSGSSGSSSSSGSSGIPQRILVIGGGNPQLYGEGFFEVGNHDSASWGTGRNGEATDWDDLLFWQKLDKYLGSKKFDVLYIDQGSESHMYGVNIDNMYRCLAPHLSEKFILIVPGDGSIVGRYSINTTVIEFIKKFRRLTPFGRIGFPNMSMGVNNYQYYTLYNMRDDTSVIKFRSDDLNSAVCRIINAQGNNIHNPSFKCITDVHNITDFMKSRILEIDSNTIYETMLAEENADIEYVYNMRLGEQDIARRMQEDEELARQLQEEWH